MFNKTDEKITELLLAPRYRILRHLLLQLLVFGMAINVFWDNPNEVRAQPYGAWIIYAMLINVVVYLNMYLLVPRFLLKNKIWKYILSLAGLTVFAIFSIGILLNMLPSSDDQPAPEGVLGILLGLTSFILRFGLFVAGTSALLLFKYKATQNQHISELESATLQSELAYLKSQINPHFLFNMLNNANIMVHENAEVASEILTKLNEMLHYQLNDSIKEVVSLNKDIEFLNDFLELEKTRRDQFETILSKEGDIDSVQLPPLLFIPFVENAVKHSASENHSYVHVHFSIQNNELSFICINSKPIRPIKKQEGGLGLVNIKRRLDLLFGNKYSLEINDEQLSYTINLRLKL